MIISIGIDIVEVPRLRVVLSRTPRFATRVFTLQERTYCDGRGVAVAAQHYAARFAAKEAFFKALGTGWAQGVAWHDAEVVSGTHGAPSLNVGGEAQKRLQLLGADTVHLSLSHTAQHAVAYVILEKRLSIK